MLIAGAGGFAREVLELLLQKGYKDDVFFYDDIDPGLLSVHDKYRVIKNAAAAQDLFTRDKAFCIGVGTAVHRRKFFDLFTSLGGKAEMVISPHAHIGLHNVVIEEACVIATGTVITTGVVIGCGTLVNLNCTIGHDVRIGNFCELSPGVHISGRCIIEDDCVIGTGAVILPGIRIGKAAVIGAGAVVNRDVEPGLKVAGVPARNISGL